MVLGLGHPLRLNSLSFFVVTKVEQVRQIADCWTIQRNVRAALAGYRVGEIVPATSRQRSQSPVGLDELQDRGVICVSVRDVPGFGVLGNHERGYPGAVTKVVERLNVAGVVVAAALVEGDDDRGTLPQVFVGLDAVNDFLYEAFEQIKLRRSRVPVEPAVGLHIRNRRQRSVL